MANVLIIGINYRPETTGIAPYTADFAEHLAAQGHRVTVLTGFSHYPTWRIQPGEYRLRAEEWINGVRVLRRRNYIPSTQSALRRAAYELTFLVHGSLARPHRADAIFGVVPSLSGGLLARFFAARSGRPYGLIFQDTMAPAARQSGIGGGRQVAGLTAVLERWAARRARTVAVASQSFRPYLRDLGVPDQRIVELPNWSHLRAPSAERGSTRSRLGWSDDVTVALHAGNMGLKQGLEQVIDAARRADELQRPVRYVLMGEGSQRAALESLGKGIERLQFLPFQPEAEVPNILAAADVLLVSERPTVIDMSLPSKLTAYFAAGRPIVAAIPQDGSTAGEIERSGAGIVVPIGDPDALNAAVDEVRHGPDRSEMLGAAGRRYAATVLDFDAARHRMDELLDATLSSEETGRTRAQRPGSPGYEVLGVRINGAPFDAMLERVLEAPTSGERLSIHFATAHTLVEAQENPPMRSALAKGLVEPDGMPLVWLGRAGGRPVERVCGPDFMPALIERGISEGRSHFFYGGAPGVPELIAERLCRRYPGLKVAGTLSPPFRALTTTEQEAIAADINHAAPDYVWVGLGTPKQDLWIAANRPRLDAPALLAVGAAFDLLAGHRRRAPRWMQRTGTEWIYRLAMEPRRLGGRYTLVSARFIGLLARDRLRR